MLALIINCGMKDQKQVSNTFKQENEELGKDQRLVHMLLMPKIFKK